MVLLLILLHFIQALLRTRCRARKEAAELLLLFFTEIRSEGKFLGKHNGSRIESVARIKHVLNASHEFEIDGWLCFFEKAAL